jgi:hypothetical protein
MEKLTNGYLKIQPVEQDTCVASEKTTYEEVGKVVARDEKECVEIPIGSRVLFDSFMVKKYPAKEFGKYDWYVHKDEIVSYEE